MARLCAEIKSCRSCGSADLLDVMSMGKQSLISFPDNPKEKVPNGPLELVLCQRCKLLQLRHTFSRDVLYRGYWYESRINPTMVVALKDLVDSAARMVSLKKGSVVLDIASNDNTTLKQYAQNGIVRIGIDPSDVARQNPVKGIVNVNDFFSKRSFDRALAQLDSEGVEHSGKALIITCAAMFYDLPDPNAFLENVKKCLDRKGVFIIQMNYLGMMIKDNTFDNICHEHLEYYSLRTMEYLLQKHGLDVLNVELNDVNGGSFRIYMGFKGMHSIPPAARRNIKRLETQEDRQGLDKASTYRKYSDGLLATKKRFLKFIRDERRKGKRFCLEGASTRGLVQIQFFGLTKKDFPYALEKNPRKFGKYYADTGIQIKSTKNFYTAKNGRLSGDSPDYLYVLPYHFIDYIREQRSDFMEKGGKLIIAIPKFKVMGK